MSKRPGDEGALTLTALLLLTLATTITLTAASLAYAQKRQLAAFRDSTRRVQELKEAADQALLYLSEEDPESPDWQGSGFFSKIALLEEETGCAIELTDISSAFNLNSLSKKMITETMINNCLLPGTGADAFQQDRTDNGFGLIPTQRYSEFFEDDFLHDYATCTSGWNVNTADEFTLEQIFANITGDEFAAELFHEKIRDKRKSLSLIQPDELEAFIGVQYFAKVFPVIHAFPTINVHFADPWVIKQLLAYPAFNVSDPSASGESLIAMRDSGSLTIEDLYNAVPISQPKDSPVQTKEQNRLFAYLGTRTWFWRLTVTKNSSSLVREAAFIPEREYRITREVLPW